MAVCSWLSVPYSLLLLRMAGCSVQPRKCGDSGYGIRGRTCGYTELTEVRPGYPKCPTPNVGTIRGLALYKILLQLEQYRSSTSDRQISKVREKYFIYETFCIVWRCYNRVVSITEWRNNYWEKRKNKGKLKFLIEFEFASSVFKVVEERGWCTKVQAISTRKCNSAKKFPSSALDQTGIYIAS